MPDDLRPWIQSIYCTAELDMPSSQFLFQNCRGSKKKKRSRAAAKESIAWTGSGALTDVEMRSIQKEKGGPRFRNNTTLEAQLFSISCRAKQASQPYSTTLIS